MMTPMRLIGWLMRSWSGLAERGSGAGDDVLDVHGAAKLLGCSVPTVERLVAAGKLQSFKVGRLRRFRRADLLVPNEKGGPDE
jgi:excisionase family DNA binding protein